jgi:hypothetical protein
MDTEGNKIKDLNAEELASRARRYYAERFPNPQRLGCPPPGEITRVVRQRQLPDQALREHLFECSECFGEYRQSLEQRQAPATDENAWSERLARIWNRSRSIGVLKLSAAAASVILILSSLIILIRPGSAPDTAKVAAPNSGSLEVRPETQVQAQTGNGAPAGAQDGAGSSIQKPQVDGPAAGDLAMAGALRPSDKYAPGRKTIYVDLDEYHSIRRSPGESEVDIRRDRSGREVAQTRVKPALKRYGLQSGGTAISLPAIQATVVLRLPESGVPGKYNVSLIDAFGKSLLSTSAASSDGAMLRVPLNLRRISQKKCRLRVSRNGEAPAYYDVIIDAR